MARRPNLPAAISTASAPVAEARCNICNSVHRSHIDKLVVAGYSYSSIAEDLQTMDEDFRTKTLEAVRKNIERHAKRHVNVRQKAIRDAIEKRAIEGGIILDQAQGSITSGKALLDLLVGRATEQISDPEFKVRFADAIEAVKILEDSKRDEYMAQVEVMQKQVWAISQAVKEIVPEELLNGLVTRAEELFVNPTQELER
jgi:hypothetical protein